VRADASRRGKVMVAGPHNLSWTMPPETSSVGLCPSGAADGATLPRPALLVPVPNTGASGSSRCPSSPSGIPPFLPGWRCGVRRSEYCYQAAVLFQPAPSVQALRAACRPRLSFTRPLGPVGQLRASPPSCGKLPLGSFHGYFSPLCRRKQGGGHLPSAF